MKLFRVKFTFDATNMDPDWFETYVIAMDIQDAIRHVSGFTVDPGIRLGFETDIRRNATVGLAEECFYKMPIVTERAKAERNGMKYKECEARNA